MRLEYDIVIATKDRPDALACSIPRMLSQYRKPCKIVIIDSSENHKAVCELIETLRKRSGFQHITVHWCVPGLPKQRNAGLEYVTSPVVMFPDDDSIWYPNTAEAIMRIYEKDSAHEISAVCAAEARTPPPGFFDDDAPAYRMQRSHAIQHLLGHIRARLEHRFFPDPFVIHGRAKWKTAPKPNWLDAEDAVLVECMTGYRMSFRTEAIRACGFDETLDGYALFEDADASFSAMLAGHIVGVRNTQVYHHRMPGGRGGERKLGVTQILNRAYVICKHSPSGEEARRRLLPYGHYKIFQYALRASSPSGRQRFLGAWIAQRQVKRLLDATRDELPIAYRDALRCCLENN